MEKNKLYSKTHIRGPDAQHHFHKLLIIIKNIYNYKLLLNLL